MDFNISKEILSEKIIGEIFYQNKSTVYVKEFLVNGKKEIIELNHDVWDIIALDKTRVVFSNPDSHCLTFYDQNFNLLRNVERINGESFTPYGLACNNNHLYIADRQNDQILMTDFEFNKIKSVGTHGNANNQFNKPGGMCLKNEILYICDLLNHRIQVYNKNLEFITSTNVNYKPWVIKASISLLFVQAAYTTSLFIYELNGLNLKQKIDDPQVYCRLSVINSNIYRFNSESKSVLIYDENGNLKEEIIINIDDNIISNIWDGTFIEFNRSLLMTSWSAKKLIKFSRK